MKTALITGVSGQDGSLLAALLLDKGYRVVGTTRESGDTQLPNLTALGIRDRVELRRSDLATVESMKRMVDEVAPDEAFALAGQSSVGLSFQEPHETFERVGGITIHLLEAIRLLGRPIRVFNAASGECFGETGPDGATETTPLRPRSPYAVAKASSFWATKVYREAYGLYACSAFLFNHESPLRPPRFVTRKIVAAACRIAAGSMERLTIGDLSIQRDWGWASDYVDAMWRMLQGSKADDYVIATGETHTLGEFVTAAFEALGLEAARHVEFDPSLLRANETTRTGGDPSRAREHLGWTAQTRFKDVVRRMVDAERLSLASGTG